jgi:hypothetical protein
VTDRSSEFLTHAPANRPVPFLVHGATLQSNVSDERHMELGIIAAGNVGDALSAASIKVGRSIKFEDRSRPVSPMPAWRRRRCRRAGGLDFRIPPVTHAG